jgi:hypothetical protein
MPSVRIEFTAELPIRLCNFVQILDDESGQVVDLSRREQNIDTAVIQIPHSEQGYGNG